MIRFGRFHAIEIHSQLDNAVTPTPRRLRFSTVLSLRQAAGTTLLATTLASAGHAQTPAAEPVQIPTVSVQSGSGQDTGYQVLLPTLPKLTEPLLDTPQSINVVPRQLMNEQATTTVADALRNVPGISLAAGEAGAQGNNLTIRGFSARNDFYLDGMRGFGSYFRDPFDLEEIEVLKGPASILFGRGSTGGVINQVTKRPLLAPLTTFTTTIGTDGTYPVSCKASGARTV